MADRPINGFVKEIKIGNNDPKPIAAPYMYEKEGTTENFYTASELKDFKQTKEFNDLAVWVWEFPVDNPYFKKTPNVVCVNTDGEQILGDIKYEDTKITISFNVAMSGICYLN